MTGVQTCALPILNMTDQRNTVALTTATGEMTINISLPVSPGQVNGQKFTFYETSIQYPNLTGIDDELLERTVQHTLGNSVDRIAIKYDTGGLTNFYINMPVVVENDIGGLTSGTTYYVIEQGYTTVTVTHTQTSTNKLSCSHTDVLTLYVDMPIVFSGTSLGGVELTVEYYVNSVDSMNNVFTISNTPGGATTTILSIDKIGRAHV